MSGFGFPIDSSLNKVTFGPDSSSSLSNFKPSFGIFDPTNFQPEFSFEPTSPRFEFGFDSTYPRTEFENQPEPKRFKFESPSLSFKDKYSLEERVRQLEENQRVFQRELNKLQYRNMSLRWELMKMKNKKREKHHYLRSDH